MAQKFVAVDSFSCKYVDPEIVHSNQISVLVTAMIVIGTSDEKVEILHVVLSSWTRVSAGGGLPVMPFSQDYFITFFLFFG